MKPVAAILLVLVINLPGASQSADRLPDDLTKRTDKLFEQWDKPNSAGCALGVIKDGRIIYEHGYGMADLEHSAPITPQTLFDIGSIAKQFTGMAVLLLAEQGKLSLDDDIHKFVPEVPDYGVKISLRHLLYHTSGLRNQFLLYQLRGWRWGDLESSADALATVARQTELNFAPGSEHSYSNTGYILLGEVVRRVSGMTLRDFVARNIFGPLGMNSSQIHDDVSLIMKNRAWGYGLSRPDVWVNNFTRSEEVGDSNVYTTIEDFARWDQNFYEAKVGGAQVGTQMVQPGTLNSGRALSYAAGLRLTEYKGLKLIRHAGSTSSRAEYLRFPDQRFSVVCFCNSGSIDPSALAEQVADLYLSDHLRPEPKVESPTTEAQAKGIAEVESFIKAHAINLKQSELAKFVGFYINTDNGSRRHLLMKDGKLMVERRPGVESELVPIAVNRFVMAGVPARLEISFEERYPQFRVMLVSSGPETTPLALVYAGQEFAGSVPISEYAGAFESDEVDAEVSFVAINGQLVLRAHNFEEPRTSGDVSRGWYPLEPVCVDAFRNEWIGLLRFTRDAKQQINGFFISNFAGGVRHLKFQKPR